MPLRIYSGHIVGIDAVWAISLQILWLAVLVGLGKVLMAKALRKVVVQGG